MFCIFFLDKTLRFNFCFRFFFVKCWHGIKTNINYKKYCFNQFMLRENVFDFYFFWNGSRSMAVVSAASDLGSTCDKWLNPSSSTKQISNWFGSDKIITRTVAFPGVSSDVNGCITISFRFVTLSFNSVWSSNGIANAIRPNAVFRSIISSKWVKIKWNRVFDWNFTIE